MVGLCQEAPAKSPVHVRQFSGLRFSVVAELNPADVIGLGFRFWFDWTHETSHVIRRPIEGRNGISGKRYFVMAYKDGF